jgi:putative transposase
MADEQNNEKASANGANGSTAGVEVKKTRAPRRPKTAVNAAANDESAIADKPAKKTRAKRGSRGSEAKGPKITRLASSAKPTTSAVTTIVDELTDLLTLEKENRSLRKQLADKLRAENVDLRKRLGSN